MSTIYPFSKLRQEWLKVLVLSGLAVGLNLLEVDLGMGFEFHLGSSLAVFGLLLLGDLGLLVGLSGSLVAGQEWDHPLCMFIETGQLLWLNYYIGRISPNEECNAKGNIISADILFWIVVGVPLALLLASVDTNVEPSVFPSFFLSHTLNGIICTTIGFTLYLIYRVIKSRRDPAIAISAHSLLIASIMLSFCLAIVPLKTMESQLYAKAIQQGELSKLQLVANTVLTASKADLSTINRLLKEEKSPIEFELISSDPQVKAYQSNPDQFAFISNSYQTDKSQIIRVKALELLTARNSPETEKTLVNGFWKYSLDSNIDSLNDLKSLSPRFRVNVIEPARPLIRQTYGQVNQMAIVQICFLIFAGLVSKLFAQVFSRQLKLAHQAVDVSLIGSELTNTNLLGTVQSTKNQVSESSFINDINSILNISTLTREQLLEFHDKITEVEIKLEKSREENLNLRIIDPLTGCYNRLEFSRRLEFEQNRTIRAKNDLSCISIEVDHYADVRDSYGAEMGEKILAQIAEIINLRIRATDCLCRSGEAGFSLLLPICSRKSAATLAETLREEVEKEIVRSRDQNVYVTISLGISCFKDKVDTGDSLVYRSEAALYQAKAEGRNRIALS